MVEYNKQLLIWSNIVFLFPFKINYVYVLLVLPIQYSKLDTYKVSFISSRQRGSSICFGKEPVCAFTCKHPPCVIWNNLAAATQGTDGLGVPQCPRFREVQHKHKVFQGGWEPEITLMWRLSQPKTNCCSCFIHNKCTSVYTTFLKYISETFLHGKQLAVPIPRAKNCF